MFQKKPIIVIVGPTASGKSDLANYYASINDCEIVSADSMQIYKFMNIGTGKIKKEEQLVNHYGLDICLPNQSYSAALFQKYSRKCFNEIWSHSKNIILCGGTGFYIRSAIDDYNFIEGRQTNNNIREKYEKFLEDNGAESLWKHLYNKDKLSANQIHPNNTIRVIRALEMYEKGQSYANQLKNLENIKQKYNAVFFGLKIDREILINRINNRVDKMFDNGLVDEVKFLIENNFQDSITSKYAIGYKEVVNYLNNKISLEEAKEQIQLASRRYAKRQRTWFRKDKRINWIDYNNMDKIFATKFIDDTLNKQN